MTPSAPKQARLIVGCLGCLHGLACHEASLLPGDIPAPEIVWEGDHVHVGTDLDLDEWCGGNLTRLDEFTGVIKSALGAPRDLVVTYYLFEDPPADLGACPINAVSCAIGHDGGTVLTDRLPDDHEIVHAIGWGHRLAPHFFEEGAATYWGGVRAEQTEYGHLDIREVLDSQWNGGMDPRDYALAAHFTSYLIDTFGTDRYRDLREGTSAQHSRAQFEDVFSSTMGASLGSAIDSYESGWPYCDLSAVVALPLECGRPADYTLAMGEEIIIEADVACSEANVLGPFFDTDVVPRIRRDLLLEIEGLPDELRLLDATFLSPELGEDNSVEVEIKRCSTNCEDVAINTRTLRPQGTTDMPDFFTFELTPGRYIIRISRSAADPGLVRFQLY